MIVERVVLIVGLLVAVGWTAYTQFVTLPKAERAAAEAAGHRERAEAALRGMR